MSTSTCWWWAAASPARGSPSTRRPAGLRTALVERHDFASGTSSKSSKLVHGGLRYLQQGEYALVYEGLAERQRLRKTAPHLVRVLPFLIPIFSKRRAHQPEDRAGPRVGDVDVRPHRRRAHRQAAQAAQQGRGLAHMPTMPVERLASAYLYYDAHADDARLTLAIARTAAAQGAAVANYARRSRARRRTRAVR